MIISHRTKGQGYYISDERASGGGVAEADVICCPHCQAVILQSAWKVEGGFCGRCFAPICAVCAAKMDAEGCVPFLKKIDRILEENYRARQNERALGV
jgi:hypothetical protein